jgi:hypothetical protein
MARASGRAPASGPVSLADRLAEAERAEAAARKQWTDLQALYDAAVADSDHGEAGRLKPMLDGARQELLVGEATVTGLRTALETISNEQTARAQAAELAQRRADAQRVIGEAIVAERNGVEQISECLAQFWELIRAAQDEFRRAQEWEIKVGRERRRVMETRILTGELDAMPAHVATPNHASVLIDTEPLVRLLTEWRR